MSSLWVAYKDYVHQVSVAVALFLILFLGIIVNVRIAMGLPFPPGNDQYIWALVALAGVNVAGVAAIRATGVPYQQAKAAGKVNGAAQVNVAGDANVQTAATAEHSIPQAGVKPRNPDVRRPLEQLAARDDDPGII